MLLQLHTWTRKQLNDFIVRDNQNDPLGICSFHAANTPSVTMQDFIESASFTSAYVTFTTNINWIAKFRYFRAPSNLAILHERLIISERSIYCRYSASRFIYPQSHPISKVR